MPHLTSMITRACELCGKQRRMPKTRQRRLCIDCSNTTRPRRTGKANNRFRHGLPVNSKLYKTWAAIKQRCLNAKNDAFADYGGRGITICKRWADDFAAFVADVGQPPSPRLTLDRVNNDGNYEPGNVRWATYKEQANNRRKPARPPHRHYWGWEQHQEAWG